MIFRHLDIDSGWALFLDRDGVINKRIPDDYVKSWDEFEFLKDVPEAIRILSGLFDKIFIVTNQQGIGRGLMTEVDLDRLHDRLLEEVRYAGGRIHKIYHSPYREEEKSVFRKPNIGMARKAKIDFPGIEFNKSMMVGDSGSDMLFGRNAGMVTVFIHPRGEVPQDLEPLVDFVFPDLISFAKEISSIFSGDKGDK